MAGEGRQGNVVLIMGKGEELKKYERKNKTGRKRKGEVMNQMDKVDDRNVKMSSGSASETAEVKKQEEKKVKMSSGSTSGMAEVEKIEEKKVRETRGSTATAAKESPRKWPVRERKEKESAKLKEKIDKCVKECLFDFCELLDIPVTKESKKVELSAKLLEFLESPHATTDVLLARKRQSKRGNKRTRTVNMIKASSPEELAEVEGSLEERTNDEVTEKEEHDESKEQEDFLPEKENTEVMKALEEKEQDTQGETEMHAEAQPGPTHEEMLDMLSGLLKEVDFEVVTFSDIRKRIEAYFNISLSHRKAEIRKLIENAITDMMERDEGEEESEYSENDA
ncbi:hypothetical protein MRB53_007788 [Persea americana]|uniref:Uncharacterized protein n=1 Tax=Persea americana TaxID=3435 RepID=A0ACC2MKX6_PERAE|nr:hypothetical protein MRB53_007788 [Persea americana]